MLGNILPSDTNENYFFMNLHFYNAFMNGVWVGEFMDGVWVGGFMDGVWVGGFMDGVWVGGFMDGVWVGGFMDRVWVGGFMDGVWVGGFMDGVWVGGFMDGVWVGGFMDGVWVGGFKILRGGGQNNPVLRILWSALISDLNYNEKLQAERPKVRSFCNFIDLPWFYLVRVFSFQITVFDVKIKFMKEENLFDQECFYECVDGIQDIVWQVLVFSFLTFYVCRNSLCI